MEELKAAGMLDMRLPPDFRVTVPDPDAAQDDEDPLDENDTLPELRGRSSKEHEDMPEVPSNVIAGPGLRETAEEPDDRED